MASSPRILKNRQAPSDAEAMQQESPCRSSSSLRVLRRQSLPRRRPGALRNTSHARRQAAKLCYRFGPLTPSARSANPDRRRRDEERRSSSEQRTGKNQKPPLDRKSPIQVRIHLPPAESRANFRYLSGGAPSAAPTHQRWVHEVLSRPSGPLRRSDRARREAAGSAGHPSAV